jgi:hypothetical protein
MADTRKIFRIFLASPSDLQEERRITKGVVDEFNNVWADGLGYHVELVGWEDTVSVFGRPQATINLDLARCELFIGMLWKRWGTAPDALGRYTSGFEEEFSISVESHQKNGRPEISLFFKAVDDEILRDPGDELKKVIAFRDRIISERILLYEKFSDAREFEGKVRRCLSTYVQRLKAKEAEESSDESRTRPTEDASKVIPEERSVGETALSAEGERFLREFVARTERENVEESSITPIEVARFRLLGDVIRRPGNDDHLLAVHDANILFVNRSAFTPSLLEVTGLVGSGLEHYSSENTPLWHWYAEANGFSRHLLTFYSFFSGSNERRVGALAAARLIGEQLPTDRRKASLEAWFSNDAPNALKGAALGYLGDYGTSGDLTTIKQELNRGEYQTTSACIDAIIRITLKESREKAILALYELQPESINRKLLHGLFENSAAISTDLLRRGPDTEAPRFAGSQ